MLKLEKAKSDALLNAFRSFLLMWQQLHQSQWYVTHDAFSGVLGMITSYLDVSKIWKALK